MIATEKSCPSPGELHDLAGGLLPTERFAYLLEHVDGCSSCQSRLDTSVEVDSFISALGASPAADPLAAEPDCLAALHRAASAPHELADRSTPPVENLGVYRLIRPLGQGAMGAVYLAEHTRLRRRCAVKLLPRDRGFDAQWRERFDREMAAVAGINHPHVVAATDAGESSGWHFLVMEYLDGLDLGRVASRMPPLQVADACELARQAAAGLAEIHATGLVHRDVKPSNLMLTRDGIVKILDLGLVMPGADPLPRTDRLTTVGHLMGTLAYMAPEQLADSQAVDFRADLYALGATLYRLLTGVAPHDATRGLAPLVIAKTAKDAPSIATMRPNLPAELVLLVDALLSRDPLVRGDSAAAVGHRLALLVAGANVGRLCGVALREGTSEEERAGTVSLTPPAVTFAPPPRPPRRWRWLAAAAGLPLLVLAGIVIAIQTDRGQLVIESEMEDVAVRVQQGGEMVDQLQLETGENRVTLRSGTYTVSLDTPADGIRLSENTATVTRGGEAVLKVRRDAFTTTLPTDGDDVMYRGRSLPEWLAILQHERDVELVIDAMTAAVELTKDLPGTGDGPQAKVAQSILLASRRFGDWGHFDSGNALGGGNAPVPPTERFMRHMPTLFYALLPEPGLSAVTDELEQGNDRSTMAALAVLAAYVNRQLNDYAQPKFGQLEEWGETDKGRARLQRMALALDAASQRLGGYELELPTNAFNETAFYPYNAVTAAYQVRLKLAVLLNENPHEIPQLGERLTRALEKTAKDNRKTFSELTPVLVVDGSHQTYSLVLTEEIVAAARYGSGETLLWAALPQVLSGSYQAIQEEEIEAALSALVDEFPEQAAHASLVAMQQRARMGVYGGTAPLTRQALWEKAVRNLAEHVGDLQLASSWLMTLRGSLSDAASKELTTAVDTALARLAERVASP